MAMIKLQKYHTSWDRFNETSLPDKVAFCSNLNMEDMIIGMLIIGMQKECLQLLKI